VLSVPASRRLVRALAGSVLAGTVVLGGCTAPDERRDVPTSPPREATPEEQVVAVATELGTSSDPRQCTELYTARGLEVAVGSTDLEACREAVHRSEPADEVVVDQVVVDGAGATARVTSIGGASAGLAQTLELVREDGRWRVDGVAGLAIADRAALDERVSRELARWGPQVVPPDRLRCVDEELRAVPDAEVVAAFREGRPDRATVDAVSWCVASGVDSVALYEIVRYQLATKGLTREQADCVAVEALGTFLDLTLEQLVTSEEAREQLDQGLLAAAETPVCARLGGP
jgi:hypothetical protein